MREKNSTGTGEGDHHGDHSLLESQGNLDDEGGATAAELLHDLRLAVDRLEQRVAAMLPPAPPEPEQPDDGGDDDLAPHNLIETTAAAERWGFPRDTIARWCRDGAGEKRGGRWLASIPRIKRRIELNRTWYPNGSRGRAV
jgi:hypothetical protein